MNERCSTILLNKFPLKEKDPESFTIPCDISQSHINNALADLGASISLEPYTMYEKLGLGEPKATRVWNLQIGDDEVIFDMDQLIKRSLAEDDECYEIDDLDDTVNTEAHELLANDMSISFLLKRLEKSIDQSDLKSCESFECDSVNDSDSGEPIWHIEYVNTSYPVTQKIAEPNKVETEQLYLAHANEIDEKKTTKPNKVKTEQLYSARAHEIDEKKPKLNFFPQHLQYAYLHGDKYFPIIISSRLSEREKMLLLQVLEKRKGEIAWKMSNIKGISPSYYTHKILMEDDYKLVIQP
nr:hypothetical protein [Tanacetum cinerariifolium]